MIACVAVLLLTPSTRLFGQLIDQNNAPNTASEGIFPALTSGCYPTQIGAGRGRQLFQRKFTRLEGRTRRSATDSAPLMAISESAPVSPTAAQHATGGREVRPDSAATRHSARPPGCAPFCSASV
jgi:hypothetical protein